MLQGELWLLSWPIPFSNSKSIDSFPPRRLRVWLCLTPFQLLLKKKKKCHRLGACKERAFISPALEAGGQGRVRAEAVSGRTRLLDHGGLCSLCPPMEAGLEAPGGLCCQGTGPPTPVTSSPPKGPLLTPRPCSLGNSRLPSSTQQPPCTTSRMPDSAAPMWPRRSRKEASTSPLCVREK